VTARKPAVLVVEDSDTMWFLYHELLGEEYELFRATDGRQALHQLVRVRPDLVVLDWTLDDIRAWDEEEIRLVPTGAPSPQRAISGLDVLRAIKRSALRSTPVIMLTGHSGLHEKLLGKLLRADRYLTKPLNERAFVKAVHRLLPPAPDQGQHAFAQEPEEVGR